jgi:hypothetical protein
LFRGQLRTQATVRFSKFHGGAGGLREGVGRLAVAALKLR